MIRIYYLINSFYLLPITRKHHRKKTLKEEINADKEKRFDNHHYLCLLLFILGNKRKNNCYPGYLPI